MIYIYIVIHRQICFVLSELISVARQYLPVAGIETRLTETPSQSFWPFCYEEILATKYIFKRLWITITIVYIHPFKRPPISQFEYEETCKGANGNTIISSQENSTLRE